VNPYALLPGALQPLACGWSQREPSAKNLASGQLASTHLHCTGLAG